jgi:hypothetical protein
VASDLLFIWGKACPTMRTAGKSIPHTPGLGANAAADPAAVIDWRRAALPARIPLAIASAALRAAER